MALIRILVKEGLTGLFYVQNGSDSRKSSLIDPTQDKYSRLGTTHIWQKCGQNSYFLMSDVSNTTFMESAPSFT